MMRHPTQMVQNQRTETYKNKKESNYFPNENWLEPIGLKDGYKGENGGNQQTGCDLSDPTERRLFRCESYEIAKTQRGVFAAV